jgi:hypothetical protein
LGPIFEEFGYDRLKGTSTAAWVRAIDSFFIVAWLQPSRSPDPFGWFGTSFVIEFRRGERPQIGVPGPSFRLGELLDDVGRERVRAVQNDVIRKLPPAPREALAAIHGDTPHWYLAHGEQRVQPYSATEDLWFRHREQQDLDQWWALLRELLPGALREVDTRLGTSNPPNA